MSDTVQTMDVQLIGNPHDGKVTEITAQEMRMDESVFLPYVPSDSDPQMDLAYAEYVRAIYGTPAGQIMTYINPSLPMPTAQNVMQSILDGQRSPDGVWVLQGAGVDGQLQMAPLNEIQ